MRFASHGPRLVAYIVDVIIISLLVVAVAIVLALLAAVFASSDSAGLAVITALVLVAAVIVIPLAYFPCYWARSGQTPGMRMFRLRVVRDRDGGPISGGQAILRLIGYWVSGAVFYLGYIWIFIDGRRRGWHDLIAGTVVIEA